MIIHNWPRKAPPKFIRRLASDKQTTEIQPLRALGVLEECQRCFIPQTVANELETKLTLFVCRSCRHDDQEWDYEKRLDGVSYSVGAMVNEQPDKYYTDHQSGEGRN